MEGIPRVPMSSFMLKDSIDAPDFTFLKKYIKDHYGESSDAYDKELAELSQLRTSACAVPHDFTGLSTLKRYFAQLQLLKGRFPMEEGEKCSILFQWDDLYLKMPVGITDVRLEEASILYNIGALHSLIGSKETRTDAEGMKVSCTHFQCAAWAFQHILDRYSPLASPDLDVDILKFGTNLMLAQAQECILEKSIIDNRKSGITAKIAQQLVEFYHQCLGFLDSDNVNYVVNGRRYKPFAKHIAECKDWKRRCQIKSHYYRAMAYYFMGSAAEEGSKYGEQVTWYTAAFKKLQEAEKLVKDVKDPNLHDSVQFAHDVIGGKYESSKKDNDFIYHERIPEMDTLPEIRGASLVKGVSFNPQDPEVSGPDIFAKLVPMETHEAASLYSEEKARFLREIGDEIEAKDLLLEQTLSCLNLDSAGITLEDLPLPQELFNCCAKLGAQEDPSKELVVLMKNLVDVSINVESGLNELAEAITQENEKCVQFESMYGHPISSWTSCSELSRIRSDHLEFTKTLEEARTSNTHLRDALSGCLNDVKILGQPIDVIRKNLPSVEVIKTNEEIIGLLAEAQRLLGKVSEMRNQRNVLFIDLRSKVHSDDVTKSLLANKGTDIGGKKSDSEIFAECLKKHTGSKALLQQNMAAQEKIVQALVDHNAVLAPTKEQILETKERRRADIEKMVASYDTYLNLLKKCEEGIHFYSTLLNKTGQLRQAFDKVVKSCQAERERILVKFAPQAVAPRTESPGPSMASIMSNVPLPDLSDLRDMNSQMAQGGGGGPPRLKDFLPYMKPETFGHRASLRSDSSPLHSRKLPTKQSSPQHSMRSESPSHNAMYSGQDPRTMKPPLSEASQLPSFQNSQINVPPSSQAGGYNPQFQAASINPPSSRHQQPGMIPSTFGMNQQFSGIIQPPQQGINQQKPALNQLPPSSQQGQFPQNQFSLPSNYQNHPAQQPFQGQFQTTQPRLGQTNQQLSQPHQPERPQGPMQQPGQPQQQMQQQRLPQGPMNQPGRPQSPMQHPGQPQQQMQQQGLPQGPMNQPGRPQSPMNHPGQPQQQMQHPGQPQQQMQHRGQPQQQMQHPGQPQQQMQHPGQPQQQMQQQGQQMQHPGQPQQQMQQPGQPQQQMQQPGQPQQQMQHPSQPQQQMQQPGQPQQRMNQPVRPQSPMPQPGQPQVLPTSQMVPANYQGQVISGQIPCQIQQTGQPQGQIPPGHYQGQMPSGQYQNKMLSGTLHQPGQMQNQYNRSQQPGQFQSDQIPKGHSQLPVQFQNQQPNQFQGQNRGETQQLGPMVQTDPNKGQLQNFGPMQQTGQFQNQGQQRSPFQGGQSQLQGQTPRPGQLQGPPPSQFQAPMTQPAQFQGRSQQPGQFQGQPQQPGQFQNRPQQPGQPGQFQGQPQQPGQFQNRPQQSGQFHGHPQQPGQFHSQPQQPGQFQGQTQQPGQYQGQPQQPGQFQGQTQQPGQFQGQPQQPGQFQGQTQQPAQFQGQTQQPGKYQGQPQQPCQFQGQSQQPGQFQGQSQQPGQFQGQPQQPGQSETRYRFPMQPLQPGKFQGHSQSNVTSTPCSDSNNTQQDEQKPSHNSDSPPRSLSPSTASQQRNTNNATPTTNSIEVSTIDPPHHQTGSDDLLSSSPMDASSNPIVTNGANSVLTPHVLTREDIEEQKEAEQRLRALQGQSSNPLNDNLTLNRFIADVERLYKRLGELERSDSRDLLSMWKVLTDAEKAGGRRSAAIARLYQMKNKSQNHVPYDDTRVILKDAKCDYINASFIDFQQTLPVASPRFLACQAPLSTTMTDYWTMIFEQGCEVVACLFPCQLEQVKHLEHWPQTKGESRQFGPFEVTLQAQKDRDHWTERVITVKHKNTHHCRTLVHFVFEEMSQILPHSVEAFNAFINELHVFYKQQRNPNKPIAVVCNTGCGPSGLLIALSAGFFFMEQLGQLPDLVEIVTHLWRQRAALLENRHQLSFAWSVLAHQASDILVKRNIIVGPGRNSAPRSQLQSQSSTTSSGQTSLADTLFTSQTVQLSDLRTAIDRWTIKPAEHPSNSSRKASIHSNPGAPDDLPTSPGSSAGLSSNTPDPTTSTDAHPTKGRNSAALPDLLPASLQHLGDPDRLELTPVPPEKRRVTRRDFEEGSNRSDSLGVSNDPQDPFKSIDPMWSMKKN